MQPRRRLVAARDRRAGAGSRYGFRLDGGPARPDPRSPPNPTASTASPRSWTTDAFTWADRGWRGLPLRGAVLYELHVGTFTPRGTFDAAIEHLAHLVALGVGRHRDCCRWRSSPGARGWGYDGVDLFAPHHAYGGPEGLKRLIDACHAAGLGVIIDVVYNHLGPAGNYLAEFGPYFSDRHRTNWGAALNFDGPGSDEVSRFVIDNALMWLRDYHADGLRLDAVHAIIDDSAVPHPRRAGRGGGRAGDPPGPAALPHRRERPQRPPLRAGTRRWRLRPRRDLGRRVAPCLARRPHR